VHACVRLSDMTILRFNSPTEPILLGLGFSCQGSKGGSKGLQERERAIERVWWVFALWVTKSVGQWLGVLLAFFTAEPARPINDHRLAFSMAEPARVAALLFLTILNSKASSPPVKSDGHSPKAELHKKLKGEAGRPLSETGTSCNGRFFDGCAFLLFSTPKLQVCPWSWMTTLRN
jgi:hypothetical protein